jgi:hypothetical protein
MAQVGLASAAAAFAREFCQQSGPPLQRPDDRSSETRRSYLDNNSGSFHDSLDGRQFSVTERGFYIRVSLLEEALDVEIFRARFGLEI